MYYNSVDTIVFERATSGYDGSAAAIRLIAFEKDEDSGALSVFDIIEVFDDPKGHKTLAQYAEEFGFDNDDVTVKIGGGKSLTDIDFGRAKKTTSRAIKLMEQM